MTAPTHPAPPPSGRSPADAEGGGAASNGTATSSHTAMLLQVTGRLSDIARELAGVRATLFQSEHDSLTSSLDRGENITSAREQARYSNVAARVTVIQLEGELDGLRAWHQTLLNLT